MRKLGCVAICPPCPSQPDLKTIYRDSHARNKLSPASRNALSGAQRSWVQPPTRVLGTRRWAEGPLKPWAPPTAGNSLGAVVHLLPLVGQQIHFRAPRVQ